MRFMTQDEALQILKTGANVFLTGEPGAGKTHTINRYVSYLRSCGIEPAITASTGIASTHIGGMTIHAWSGIGVKSALSDMDLDNLLQKERVVRRVRQANILLIDEISMLSSNTLDMVDLVCRTLRSRHEPFGGLQVIFVGDFFQLPPVEKRDARLQREFDDIESEEPYSPFAFSSKAWREANPVVCYLTEQHRQEDAVFLDALSTMRRGRVNETVRACLRGRCVEPPHNAVLTKLFPHNADVDRLNDAELAKLKSTAKIFHMQGSGAPLLVEALKKSCLSPEALALKIGAKVMFTKNHPDGDYVNGTTGEVTAFSPTNGAPIVKIYDGRVVEAEPAAWAVEDNGRKLAEVSQVPLRLAWAITVHKSQGMSLDSALIDLSQAFEYGQGYVALSRLRSLGGLYLRGFNERALQVHPEVLERDQDFRGLSDDASEAFGEMESEKLRDLHEKFVRACGGQMGAGQNIKPKRAKIGSTYDETKELLAKKLSLSDMAKVRGITPGTIIAHLEKLAEEGKIQDHDIAHLMPKRFDKMRPVLEQIKKRNEGKALLTPARNALGSSYTFDELRLARLFL